MKKKNSILILTPFYEPNVGGVETHLKDLTVYLKKNESAKKVYVLTYQPLTTKACGPYFEKDKNVTILRVPWIGFDLFHKLEPYPVLEFLYITPWLFLCAFFFLLFSGNNINVIHAHGFNSAFIARILAGIFKKRFVATTHAVYEMDPKSFTAKVVKWTLTKADKILTLSEASRREIVKFGVPSDMIDTYTYWVDQDIFKPIGKEDAKKEIQLSGKFVILFVGRFIEIKGIDILLEIAKLVKKDICFAFVGDGPVGERIKSEATGNKNILFIGKINNAMLPVYYNAADILCVPSQYEEGFGRVILESLSCGTPVIASDKGGIPEAMDDRVGILTSPTVKDFHHAISHLHENREELANKTRYCREFALKRFGFKNAEKIVRSYLVAVAK